MNLFNGKYNGKKITNQPENGQWTYIKTDDFRIHLKISFRGAFLLG